MNHEEELRFLFTLLLLIAAALLVGAGLGMLTR